MTKRYKIRGLSKELCHQIAIGIYGSDDLPPAFQAAVEDSDMTFLAYYAAEYGTMRSNGTFRTKRAANFALRNLERYNWFGGGWLQALGKPMYHCVLSIEEVLQGE